MTIIDVMAPPSIRRAASTSVPAALPEQACAGGVGQRVRETQQGSRAMLTKIGAERSCLQSTAIGIAQSFEIRLLGGDRLPS
jgi:hypothetical protein